MSQDVRSNSKNILTWGLLGAISVGIGLFVGSFAFNQNTNYKTKLAEYIPIEIKGEYNAIFLTNGQTYFGKIEEQDKELIKFTDIYYLRLTQDLHNQKFDELKNPLPDQLVLIKLGKELHGPQDTMYINKDQILFIEELQNNSMVVNAIKDYEKNK